MNTRIRFLLQERTRSPALRSVLPPMFTVYGPVNMVVDNENVSFDHAMRVTKCNPYNENVSNRDRAACHFATNVVALWQDSGIAITDMKPDNCGICNDSFVFVDLDNIVSSKSRFDAAEKVFRGITPDDLTPLLFPPGTFRPAGNKNDDDDDESFTFVDWLILINTLTLSPEQKMDAYKNVVSFSLLSSIVLTTMSLCLPKTKFLSAELALFKPTKRMAVKHSRFKQIKKDLAALNPSFPKTFAFLSATTDTLDTILKSIPSELSTHDTFASFT